ncbi:hypothetical protein J2847_004097 [Azospirillum agricola]|uniref:hypothetical protein n=1 Tax=Azospirillum agricola TaxID=1720247 RepID=UPI001AE5AE61|nr:hypothetical protein [Azospirillum agricola]MBP2230788.1 hypothetical protein [Azospirillum agricola]
MLTKTSPATTIHFRIIPSSDAERASVSCSTQPMQFEPIAIEMQSRKNAIFNLDDIA